MISVLMVLAVLFGFPGTNTAQAVDDGKKIGVGTGQKRFW